MSEMTTQPGQTDHACFGLLVESARQSGLVDALNTVPIRQKVRVRRPQTKVLELLVAILGGLPHLEVLVEMAITSTKMKRWRWPDNHDYQHCGRACSDECGSCHIRQPASCPLHRCSLDCILGSLCPADEIVS